MWPDGPARRKATMTRITRIAINILIGLGAIVALTAPMVGAMILALSLFPDSPTDAIPTIIVVAGTGAGLSTMWLYSTIMDRFIPANRDFYRDIVSDDEHNWL